MTCALDRCPDTSPESSFPCRSQPKPSIDHGRFQGKVREDFCRSVRGILQGEHPPWGHPDHLSTLLSGSGS